MIKTLENIASKNVASFAEAWIEIIICEFVHKSLKVASFAEAWIEIFVNFSLLTVPIVASFAEAWIEILHIATSCLFFVPSPPSWRRGLK